MTPQTTRDAFAAVPIAALRVSSPRTVIATTGRMRSLPLGFASFLPVALLACGGSGTGNDGGTSQLPPPDAGLPDCAFSLTDPAPKGRQGAHLALPFHVGADVSELALTRAVSLQDEVSLDARELRVRLPYGTSQAQYAVRVTCAGQHTEHPVHVEVEALPWTRAAQWQEGQDGPLAREYFSWWMDEADPDRLLLFGGFVYRPQQFTQNFELWELSLQTGTWTELSPAGAAPALTGGRLAQEPGTGAALYLGGFGPNYETPYALHRISYARGAEIWTSLTAETPLGRGDYQPGLIWDPVRERFLSFCGVNSTTGYHCELRALQNGSWSVVPVAPGPAPSGRNGHAFGYDARNDRLILFGGDTSGSTLGDTWALELSESPPRWEKLFDASPIAPARRNAAFAIDPLNHRLFVWGGTTTGQTAIVGLIALDLTRGEEAWHAVETTGTPPARTSGAALFDAKRGRMLMGFGNSEAGIYPDLWALEL